MAIKITGLFKPGGEFPLLEDVDLLGGFRISQNLEDRDAIPVLDRKWGMLVYSLEDNIFYQLIDQGNNDLSDNTNWVVASFSGSSTSKTGNYSITFTQNDLVNGYLHVHHNLNLQNAIANVTIKDNTNSIFYPDDIIFQDKNTVVVDFRSIEPIEGTYAIIISGIEDTEEANDDNNKVEDKTLAGSSTVLNEFTL